MNCSFPQKGRFITSLSAPFSRRTQVGGASVAGGPRLGLEFQSKFAANVIITTNSAVSDVVVVVFVPCCRN